jgi:hypothetical protein
LCLVGLKTVQSPGKEEPLSSAGIPANVLRKIGHLHPNTNPLAGIQNRYPDQGISSWNHQYQSFSSHAYLNKKWRKILVRTFLSEISSQQSNQQSN